MIDGFPVHARFVKMSEPTVPEYAQKCYDAKWQAVHCRQTQHMCQVVKCADTNCCTPTRSTVRTFMPDGFIPSQAFVTKDPSGRFRVLDHEQYNAAYAAKNGDFKNGHFMNLLMRKTLSLSPSRILEHAPVTLDYYLGRVTKKTLESRTCECCGLYLTSIHAKITHVKACMGDKDGPERKVMECYVPDTQPIRLLVKVRQDWLCQLNEDEDATWMSEDMVKELFPDIIIPVVPRTTKTRTSAIASIDEFVQHPWVPL